MSLREIRLRTAYVLLTLASLAMSAAAGARWH